MLQDVPAGPPLSQYLDVVRRRWLTIVAVTVLGAAIGFGVSSLKKQVFVGSSEVVLQQDKLPSNTSTGAGSPGSQPDRFAQTQAKLALLGQIAAAAAKSAHVHMTASTLLASASVAPSSNADTLVFTVANGSPDVALRLAQAYAKAFADYRHTEDAAPIKDEISRLTPQVDTLQGLYNQNPTSRNRSQLYAAQRQLQTYKDDLTVIDSNTRYIGGSGSVTQTQPKTKMYVLGGALAGFVLGILCVFVIDALDTRVRTAADVEQLLGLPLLGRVPRPDRRLARNFELTTYAEPVGLGSEDYRKLRLGIQLADIRSPARTILITSAIPEEGKSTVAANLAVEFARAGNKTVLLDLDLRRPTQVKFFHLHNHLGVVDVLDGDGSLHLSDVLVTVPVGDLEGSAVSLPGHAGTLEVAAAGRPPLNPGDVLSSDLLRGMIQEAAAEADIVIIDSPPLLMVGDAISISPSVDTMILIARASRVRRPELDEVRRILTATPINVLGFVLTDTPRAVSYGYYDRSPSSATTLPVSDITDDRTRHANDDAPQDNPEPLQSLAEVRDAGSPTNPNATKHGLEHPAELGEVDER